MNKKEETKISIFLSLVLRHKPEELGIKIDDQGFTDVKTLIEKLNITLKDLEKIVRSDKKQRYSFNDDRTMIRANQGHSLDYVNINFKREIPTRLLYHGTTTENLLKILESGSIKKMNRNFVHLSKDVETAKQVACRRKDKEFVIIAIDSFKMNRDGIEFNLSDNGIWLVDEVPKEYFAGYIYK